MPILEIESKTKNLKNIKDLLGLNLKLNLKQMRPGLNGALFVQRSGTKKREWKTEKAPK